MENTPRWVIEKIREVKEKQLKKLDLSWYLWRNLGIKLTEIPPEIFELEWLEELDLSGNNIAELPNLLSHFPQLRLFGFRWTENKPIPDWINRVSELKVDLSKFNISNTLPDFIFSLTNLTQLDLSFNKLSTVPEPISTLTNLTTLDLKENQLITVPESISSIKNLITLDLSFNQLIIVPESISSIKNLITLDLSFNQLMTLPESISNINSLSALNLRRNQLSSVPESISNLTNLTTLDLTFNKLILLPENIGNLTNLTTLNLSFNKLSTLPKYISRITNLTTLNIRENQLSVVPESISSLTSLTTLDLSFNKIIYVPEYISSLTNLITLNLNNNELRSVPEYISKLTNLTTLDLSYNKLIKVPESISNLTNLITLDLSYNKLIEIPESISNLTNLTTLDLSYNPLEKPPLEITKKGIAAIREYFQQLTEEGLDYLYEAKLLIIGEGGAGKTTLAKKIENQYYQLREEDSTKGIEVIRWSFSIKNHKIFHVNIWDFGGQEIYHTTHQFFLTKRSLYLLVADTRKEDTDFYYWLNTVELLAEDSPLIIVKNEKQNRHRDINEKQLRGEFCNLQTTIPTNLKTNRGYDDILSSIKHYIQLLPHIGSPLPKTWVKVREALEQDSRNYISLGEYIKICEQHGFRKLKDKLQLSGYLHDLGVCLHFQDDVLLNKTVILKPKWGTDAVYKLLDNDKVINKLGKFKKSDLQNIWHEKEYALMHDELLRLMCRFCLAYEVPNEPGNYIAPQLLSENKIDYNWDENNNLILRYTYEFMPKGIITRFIVIMHQLIEEQKYVWKTGVIISKDDTKAEVIEYYHKREIKIRVTGKYKRDFMTNIIYEIDKIHNYYKHLKYQKLIPCNCPVCKPSQSPYFYKYDELRERYIHQKYSIECGKPPYNTIQILELIDDIITRKKFLEQESKDKYDEYKTQEKYGNIEINAPVERLIIQQSEKENSIMNEENKLQEKSDDNTQVTLPWAYRNGLFYLLVFSIVFNSVGIFAGILPFYSLVLTIIGALIFIITIGALQLRQDDRLSEKSFVELIQMVLKQLPLISNLIDAFKGNK